MSQHPSRFMLERHCSGDLPPIERDQTVFHLESCPACQVKVGSIREQAQRDLALYPADEFVANLSVRMGQEVRRVAQFRRVTVIAVAAAMAAAAAMILVPRPHDTIALRGSGLQVHRNRDGMPKLMESSDHVRAGDALRIVVTLPHPESVDAWFVDATGRVDRLLTGGPMPLGAGEQTLPGSAIVDSPCTDMWLVVGVGPAATAMSESTLKKLGPSPRDGSDDWVPKGCLARRLRCE
jgi:hypothetical protein